MLAGLPPAAPGRTQARSPATSLRRLEARLRTGGSAHLLGGTLDFLQALIRYAVARRRRSAR
jgi:hypothetical protein